MMRNRILEIVIFLVDYIRENQDHQSSTEEISLALKDMGYSEPEITSAYTWFLEQFNGTTEKYFSEFPRKHSSTRILTNTERMLITPDAYGFLTKLLNHSLIDDEQLELIIERVNFLASEQVTLEQIKVIASSVIFRGFNEAGNLNLLDTEINNTKSFN